MATNLALSQTRVDLIQEQFVTAAKLDGQSLKMAPLPELPATLCYVKLVLKTATSQFQRIGMVKA